MTHEKILQQDTIERYVRGRLSPDERQEFQEHFFTCDECFEQVQATERFVAGLRDSAATGVLAQAPERVGRAQYAGWFTWFRPAFILAAAASIFLAFGAAWLLFRSMPEMRAELARERRLREETDRANRANIEDAESRLETERQERARLEAELKRRAPANSNTTIAEVQPNIPLAMLQASRAAEATALTVPVSAGRLVLWIEIEESNPSRRFRLEVLNSHGQSVQTVDGLTKNEYGALAVSLPASIFQPGIYTVRLNGATGNLVSEYRLQIQRR
ncbi:MAG TPA: zf-HC2 domain-containing protein [Blastocatellia bacterium]|nr:zf-HC2 domain-containing protein [Blastocatellia bacterium]